MAAATVPLPHRAASSPPQPHLLAARLPPCAGSAACGPRRAQATPRTNVRRATRTGLLRRAVCCRCSAPRTRLVSTVPAPPSATSCPSTPDVENHCRQPSTAPTPHPPILHPRVALHRALLPPIAVQLRLGRTVSASSSSAEAPAAHSPGHGTSAATTRPTLPRPRDVLRPHLRCLPSFGRTPPRRRPRLAAVLPRPRTSTLSPSSSLAEAAAAPIIVLHPPRPNHDLVRTSSSRLQAKVDHLPSGATHGAKPLIVILMLPAFEPDIDFIHIDDIVCHVISLPVPCLQAGLSRLVGCWA